MGTSHAILLGAALCGFLCAFSWTPRSGESGCREWRRGGGHWYVVSREDGPDLAGRSMLGPGDLMASMAREGFLRLDDCRGQDMRGIWTATGGEGSTGTVWLGTRLVRSVTLLESDPLTWGPAGEPRGWSGGGPDSAWGYLSVRNGRAGEGRAAEGGDRET